MHMHTRLDNFWNNDSSVSLLIIKSILFVFSLSLTTSVTGLLKNPGKKWVKTDIVEPNARNKPDLLLPKTKYELNIYKKNKKNDVKNYPARRLIARIDS